MNPFVISPLDTHRWGVLTATARDVTSDRVPELFDRARAEGVRLLIARCTTGDSATVHALERAGARLMDTRVSYLRSLEDLPAPADETVRTARNDDTPRVQELARLAFADYRGHYHADPRLDRRACDEAYADWAVRSCTSHAVADEVLVSEHAGRLTGFATLKGEEGVLFGVSPEAQGRGLYRALMIAGLHRCAARGAHRMIVATQLQNMAVQRVWSRLGFELSASQYTFHHWLA